MKASQNLRAFQVAYLGSLLMLCHAGCVAALLMGAEAIKGGAACSLYRGKGGHRGATTGPLQGPRANCYRGHPRLLHSLLPLPLLCSL